MGVADSVHMRARALGRLRRHVAAHLLAARRRDLQAARDEEVATGEVKVKTLFEAEEPKPDSGGHVSLFIDDQDSNHRGP
jgi:hypothetical protein